LPKNPGSTLAVIQYLQGKPMMILMIWLTLRFLIN